MSVTAGIKHPLPFDPIRLSRQDLIMDMLVTFNLIKPT
jgi:hypothetical protein